MKLTILTLSILLGISSYSQFTGKDGSELKSCDCIDPISYLDYTVKLTGNYRSYDVIQFVALKNGEALSSRSFSPSKISGQITLSVLNPKNKALRTFLGKEYGRYRGNDFVQISYNTMCEGVKSNDLVIVVYGYNQVGTETTYFVDSDKIKARSVKIYDGGTEIYRGEKIIFNKM